MLLIITCNLRLRWENMIVHLVPESWSLSLLQHCVPCYQSILSVLEAVSVFTHVWPAELQLKIITSQGGHSRQCVGQQLVTLIICCRLYFRGTSTCCPYLSYFCHAKCWSFLVHTQFDTCNKNAAFPIHSQRDPMLCGCGVFCFFFNVAGEDFPHRLAQCAFPSSTSIPLHIGHLTWSQLELSTLY